MMNIGSQGRLLRITTFSSSGTWTKQSDLGFVVVELVAAGGGNASNSGGTNGASGGSSSFGSHCSATGGAGAVASSSSGAGGSGSGGDLNYSGDTGGSPGHTFMGIPGRGGVGAGIVLGGGGGGYSRKTIQRSSLGSTESVTVGTGGSKGSSGTENGKNGLVIVYEYSL